MEPNSMNTQPMESHRCNVPSAGNSFRYDVVSLFSGCGGSSLGYEWAGGKIRLAVDNDADAVATYRANFRGTPVYYGNVEDLSAEECCRLAGVKPTELGVLDGSPPCQGYSTLGSRDFADRRNGLYLEFVRLLRGIRPKTFVLENVSGLVKGMMRVIFVDCLKELKASGYQVRARLLNAKFFNVPQSRQRIIIIGIRNDLGIEATHPRAQSEPQTVRQTLKLVGVGGIRSDNQYHKKDPWRTLDVPARALTRHPPIVSIDGNVRKLTVEECALVGGFPRNFVWGRSAYRLIANSVPPPLMRAIAAHVRDNVLRAVHTASHESPAALDLQQYGSADPRQ
jgi:DNA (cytosine-5)-methyltransferase 1